MLATPLQHFTEDVNRARAMHQHAISQTGTPVCEDILRASLMMGVGACDAYFCDAYGDVLSRVLRAKDLQSNIEIPGRLLNLKVPVIAVIRSASDGWRWRMAARELIEKESVLSLNEIRELFNQFFRKPHKLINQSSIEPWILHKDAKFRCFGITPTAYRVASTKEKNDAKESAVEHFEERFELIFQRRNDCIHNCDRPKIALTPISERYVSKAIEDIQFLVNRIHEALIHGIPIYLTDCGFSSATKNQVCQ